ncbi:hypothetical protein [Pseudacidovorax sp. NFM-22]|uniref:hypothetical protein n=1 Tax=Pseudacidovorax sp. NFM-22 TaxID=2744469 RepID=UPI001F222E88|nr:hypothetical protein [Pseudacidovorax sp. NFM-22]
MDLLFQQAPAADGQLVFGDDGAPPGGDATVGGFIALRLPALAGRVQVVHAVGGALVALRPTLSGGVRYLSNTERPLVGKSAVRFQQSAQRADGVRDAAGPSGRQLHGVVDLSQAAQPLSGRLSGRFAAAVSAGDLSTVRAGQASALGGRGASRFQRALGASAWRSARFQGALGRGEQHDFRFQRADERGGRWRSTAGPALARAVSLLAPIGPAHPLQIGAVGRFQDARRPPAGIWIRPGPQPEDPCYLPSAELLFAEAWTGSPDLLFICERHSPEPPAGTVVVPIRRIYAVKNSIVLTRVDTSEPIPATGFGLNLDADSWDWQWSAQVPGRYLPVVTPADPRAPLDVLAVVNGTAFRLCIEQRGRERRFGSDQIRVSGRGRAARLDAPYSPVRNHVASSALTIQQLLGHVLSDNGVGIGWAVEFGGTDWLVPADTWSLQGTYIAGVLDIAQAAGAIVQPHRTEQTLRVLPRYPAAPWAWSELAPDFELPAAAVQVEGVEWQQKADYDRVFVAGTTAAGVLGQVTRAGTAGSNVAPMVTHSLITHADAARQRALPVLADTGPQALVTLSLQVLPETGLILPNQLVRYVDAGQERLGLVRSMSLDWRRPRLRQSITLETHLED